MPYNGSGIFTPAITFVPNTTAQAEDVNTAIMDLATGLSDAMTRDGQAPATAPISMGGFQLNEVSAGTAAGDAVNLGQVQAGVPQTNSIISGPVATARSLLFQTAGSDRFEVQLDAEAESGANAGSNVIINLYADDGVTATQIAKIVRSTNAIEFSQQIAFDVLPTIGVAGPPILQSSAGQLGLFPGINAPAGFLIANGSLVSRTTYPLLYAYALASGAIVSDTTWMAGGVDGCFSTGDGSTTFRLPDYRACFLRPWDDSRGIDAGRAIGTNQADSVGPHTHTYTQSNISNTTEGGGTGGAKNAGGGTGTTGGQTPTGTTETRPKNISILCCIKT